MAWKERLRRWLVTAKIDRTGLAALAVLLLTCALFVCLFIYLLLFSPFFDGLYFNICLIFLWKIDRTGLAALAVLLLNFALFVCLFVHLERNTFDLHPEAGS